MLKSLLKNSFFTIFGQLVVLFLGLFFAGLTIRYLGSSKAGFFILISSVLGWVNLAGGGAFHAPAVKYIAEKYNSNEKKSTIDVLKTVVSANIITGIPFALLIVVIFPILFSWSKLEQIDKGGAFIVVILSGLSFLFDQYSGALRSVYEGLQRFDLLAIVKVVIGIVSNLVRLFTLFLYKNMEMLAFANLLISIFTLFLDLFLVYILMGTIILPNWSPGILKSFFHFGLWSWLGNTSNILFFNLTSIVLTKYLGTASLMYVSLPQSIILAVGQFIISISYIIFPLLASQKEMTYNVISKIEDRLRWCIATVSFFVFTFLYLLGPILLKHLVNSDFAEHATSAFLIFCLYGIIWSQEIFHSFALMSIGKVRINSITTITTSILTLCFTVILIPFFGYLGHPLSQLMRFPGLIWHTIWSRKVLKLPNTFISIISPYITPFISIIFWGLIVYLLKILFNVNVFFEIISILLVGIISVHLMIVLEKKYFFKYERIKLIESILAFIFKNKYPSIYMNISKYLK